MLTHVKAVENLPGENGGWVGLTVSSDGLLAAVTHPADAAISVYSLENGGLLGTLGGKGTGPGRFFGPCRLCFTPTGTLLVADHGNCRLQEVTTTGAHVRMLPVDAQVFAVACTEEVIVAGKRDEGHTDGRIIVLDMASGEERTRFAAWGLSDGQLTACMGLAITADGTVAVAELTTSRVCLFTLAGVFLGAIRMTDSGFVDVCLLSPSGGHLVAADYTNKQLVLMPRGAEIRAPIAVPLEGVCPIGIACRGASVYVLGMDGTIHVFTPVGIE